MNKRKSGNKDFKFDGADINKYIMTAEKQYDTDKT